MVMPLVTAMAKTLSKPVEQKIINKAVGIQPGRDQHGSRE
jgi:hypothetical protein